MVIRWILDHLYRQSGLNAYSSCELRQTHALKPLLTLGNVLRSVHLHRQGGRAESHSSWQQQIALDVITVIACVPLLYLQKQRKEKGGNERRRGRGTAAVLARGKRKRPTPVFVICSASPTGGSSPVPTTKRLTLR